VTYVVAAYAASIIILAAYAWSVHRRRQSVEQLWAAHRESDAPGVFESGSQGNHSPVSSEGTTHD
jgi:hypothetical protein